MNTKRAAYGVASLLVLALSGSAIAQAQSTPTLAVDAASASHPINSDIYGIANYGLSPSLAEEIKVHNIRWGGDGTTRYNWEVDSSNSGFDWYFIGGNGETTPVPSASADLMIKTFRSVGADALITIPIIPYVNKSSEWSCSFPTSVYGAQQSTDPYLYPNGETCGNSISTSGAQLKDNNILANHIANTTALQQGWVEHLVATFGTAAKGGVPYYQLDNEPLGWANTHRDVEPVTPAYATIVALGQQYAAVVKQVDPTAMVLGPSDFTLGGWIGSPGQQNNLFAGQYYLQQMAAYDKAHSQRILDYFDEHYYPQFTDATSQLASTRTLWDPTFNGGTWVEQYDFDGPMQLIPRFHQWIGQYYPGTKVAISEYSIDSGNKLVTDALAEADVLGIFGQQGLDFANMWNAPASTDPIAYAFRLYRNYDGNGGQFGSTSVSASSSNPGELSVYASRRASDGALILVVVNKTTSAIGTTLSINNFKPVGSAAIYSYSSANLQKITSEGSVSVANDNLSYTYPAYSATVVVLPGATQTHGVIPAGTYTAENSSSALLLGDPGSETTAGAQMDQEKSDKGTNQQWVFAYQNGFYTVQNAASHLYLTDPSNFGVAPQPLLQEPLATSIAQMWSITGSAGNWILHNRASGRVIADPGSSATSGAGMVVETQTGQANEKWNITE